MFFNLTESPWIRAGRQYSVRVCGGEYQTSDIILNTLYHAARTCGHTLATELPYGTSLLRVSLLTGSSLCYSKMPVTSPTGYFLYVPSTTIARRTMERWSTAASGQDIINDGRRSASAFCITVRLSSLDSRSSSLHYQLCSYYLASPERQCLSALKRYRSLYLTRVCPWVRERLYYVHDRISYVSLGGLCSTS